MTPRAYKIFPLGDGALTVEFGRTIAIGLNQEALKLAATLDTNRFEGFLEAVPAYSSTTVFFDLKKVRTAFPEFKSAFAAVSNYIESSIADFVLTAHSSREINIPVEFDGEDLPVVAEFAGLSPPDVIEIFAEAIYRVYMLGFLPGFAYMGEVNARIAAPRRSSPRTKVQKGSVGIAGTQTGIYPLDSPGGWQIIGHTLVELFDPDSEEPCLVRPGDEVRFTPLG